MLNLEGRFFCEFAFAEATSGNKRTSSSSNGMARSLPEDILFLLLDLVYYDESAFVPDYNVLTTLCVVSRAVQRPAQRLLFRWVRLFSSRGVKAFVAACARKPALGRAVCIAHVRLLARETLGGPTTFAHLAHVLAQTPRIKLLVLEIDKPTVTLSSKDLAAIAALPAARNVATLHLICCDNRFVPYLLGVLPGVAALNLQLYEINRQFALLPKNRAFTEVSIHVETATAPYICAAYVADQWKEAPLEIFSVRFGFAFPVMDLLRTPTATLRSLQVDFWSHDMAVAAALCPRLVELVLWRLDLHISGTFTETLPVTLEHFAFPDDESFFNLPSIRAAEAVSVSSLPKRLSRLRTVSIFNGSQGWWTVLLSVNCALAGVAVRRFDSVDDFVKVCTNSVATA